MVGNLVPDNSGGILVEFDYNNIIVVDPNKTIDANGNIQERLVDHENLVMFVNLEAEVLPRTKLAVGGSPQNAATTVSVAKINFLAPNEKNYFSTQYYDELTGLNATGTQPKTGAYGMGINQPTETIQGNPRTKTASYKSGVSTNGISGAVENGLLGITSINFRVGLSFTPSVTIELEDVQGKALFQLGDNSPYAAFFNMPYPPFYLTMKGYYGQAIRYQLNLEKFNARFNSFSGNYQVTLEFRGYKFNILNEIQMGHLLATPHMYSTRYDLTSNANPPKNISKDAKANGNVASVPSNGTQAIISSVVTERGYEKILQVYSEYKSKGLLDPNFPELTLYQFMDKIQTFERQIMAQYTQADVQPLTDCRTYKSTLKGYYEQVYQSNDSWFSTWLNPNPLIMNDGKKRYMYKNGLSIGAKKEAIDQITKIVQDYNTRLANTGTLGKVGKFTINNTIRVDDFIINPLNRADINYVETLKEQGSFVSSPNAPEVLQFSEKISGLFKVTTATDSNTGKIEILLDPAFDLQTFIDKIRQMEAIANKKLGDFETEITASLSKKLEDDRIGLGFKPTVRNVSAIIMASAEGFIRLMDETHGKAWNLRNDEIRRNCILNNPSSASSSDAKQYHQTIGNSALESSKIPVYPWPQFFVETNEDKKGRFQLKYIADPSVVDLTKGNMYDKWPEVEFVEEYLKGLTQKFNPPVAQPPLENSTTTNLLNINALEFPQGNISYRNKDELRFFYEIWERQFLTAYFTGFGRITGPQLTKLGGLVTEYESKNIETSLGGSSPYLTYKLKNYQITANNYQNTLYSFSNQGTGRLYQEYVRDFFVTRYIRSFLEQPFSILELNQIGPILDNNLANLTPQVKTIIMSAPNELSIIDTYPFTSDEWCDTNLVGNSTNLFPKRYETTKVLTVYEPQNVISNFEDLKVVTRNRPVTNFGFRKPKNPIAKYKGQIEIDGYYGILKPEELLSTEGTVFSDSPATYYTGRQLPFNTTTSILNTPFFVNAILQGVNNWRRGNKTPYKTAAYLFLNSLPLISLREKLKSISVEAVGDTITSRTSGADDLNYMFATLKKFGAVHKLPYAWILKFGSIWHRYKTFKQTGVDILEDVWKDLDYRTAYDPITRDVSKKYNFVNTSSPDNKSQEITIQLESLAQGTVKIQPGFFPKIINDFNVFYNGYDLFSGYTDNELQGVVNNGVQIFNFQGSNIYDAVGSDGTTFNVQPWSVLLPANIEKSIKEEQCKPKVITNIERVYMVPSFGINVNESKPALVTPGGIEPGYTFNGNNAVYNGSARLFWAASNYGYFDVSKIQKPKYDEYLNIYKDNPNFMVPFRFSELPNYMKIDDVFGVFEKRILDSFEEEFLNFSKPLSDIRGGFSPSDYNNLSSEENDIYRNFQMMFKQMMLVPPNLNKVTQDKFFMNSINEQFDVLNNQIRSFMNYDVLFRFGNPSYYNRRVFASYLSHNNPQDVVDPIQFDPYVQGTLPSSAGLITLSLSKQKYPKEWLELELEIGFSTIEQLRYKNSGSYITDFFIDNNIRFTVDNIRILAPLIKMYATQKLSRPGITVAGFRRGINNYLNQCESLQNLFINGVMDELRKVLDNVSQVPEVIKGSIVDGKQTKVELYETFKALNDKWIAGGDYETKTLFEDILFLDRASRNIGDVLYVDVFDLQKVLTENAMNMNMSVYTFLAGILIQNKFSIMNLPAYVNFYNVQDVDGISNRKPEGTLDFANNMWGTFLNVDYRNSGPKMVCFFTGKPSSYVQMPDNNYYRFKDDAFELRRASDNPLIENWENKKDWGLSNRCVGFNVDVGIRNQNVFYSFNVGQDNGKATSEVIQQQLNMIDNVSGLGNSTQNTGLYNYYKQRSYPCTVVSVGNAMIQPTMYFNLRHVPMFNGPYMIQEVTHTIQPGTFQTQFTGIRQGIFDYPQIDKYLQSINQNLLTKLESLLAVKKDEPPKKATTEQGKSGEKPKDAKGKGSTENSCVESVLEIYQTDQFISTKFIKTELTQEEFIVKVNDLMIKKNNNDPIMRIALYSLCYVSTFASNKFIGYGNNFSFAFNLTNNFSPTYKNYFLKTYMCVQNGRTYPLATFQDADKFLEFMYDRLVNNISRIIKDGLWLYYNCYFPVKSISPDYFYTARTENTTIKDNGDRLRAALTSLNQLATNQSLKIQPFNVDTILNGTVQQQNPKKKENPPNNQNTTVDTTVTCLPPTIISFNPKTAKSSGPMPIIVLSGTNLYGNTKVYVGGQEAAIKEVTNKYIKFVPKPKISGKIKVVTLGGEIESVTKFEFVT